MYTTPDYRSQSGTTIFFLILLMALPIALVSSCGPEQQEGDTLILEDEVGESDPMIEGVRFSMTFENVHDCIGHDFVTAQVENTGTVPFLWADMVLVYDWEHADYSETSSSDLEYHEQERPFMPSPMSCPRRMGWGGLLRTRESAYVGVRLHLPRNPIFDGPEGLGWDVMVSLQLCARLIYSEYPSEADVVRECIDISHLLEDLVRGDERPTGPALATPPPPDTGGKPPTPEPEATIDFATPTPIILPPHR
jgi:hypothetical protein